MSTEVTASHTSNESFVTAAFPVSLGQIQRLSRDFIPLDRGPKRDRRKSH